MAFLLRLTLFVAHVEWLKWLCLQTLIALVQQIQTFYAWEHVGAYLIPS